MAFATFHVHEVTIILPVCTGGMLLLLRHLQLVLQLFASREAVDKYTYDVLTVPTLCHLHLLCHAVT